MKQHFLAIKTSFASSRRFTAPNFNPHIRNIFNFSCMTLGYKSKTNKITAWLNLFILFSYKNSMKSVISRPSSHYTYIYQLASISLKNSKNFDSSSDSFLSSAIKSRAKSISLILVSGGAVSFIKFTASENLFDFSL